MCARESEDLHRTTRKLDQIFASLGHGMYVVDCERRIQMWNRSAEAILGWSADEVLGRDCRDFIAHQDDAGNRLCETQCPLAASLSEERTIFAGTVWAHRKDGGLAPANVSCVALFDEEDNLAGAVEVFSDATVQKEMDRIKSQISSVVAHELRTPLTAMLGYLDMVINGDAGKINAEQDEFLRIVRSNVDRLQELVNDFLDLDKLETGRSVLHWEECRLEHVIEEMLEVLSPVAAEKHLEIVVDIREAPVLLCDRRLIGQVVSNLVSNAIKFTIDGEVRVSARGEGESALLVVEDTGVGIPVDELSRLGERFFRASTASLAGASGSGLGIAITREIIEKHEGELTIESRPGEGSTFMVRLPAAKRRPGA